MDYLYSQWYSFHGIRKAKRGLPCSLRLIVASKLVPYLCNPMRHKSISTETITSLTSFDCNGLCLVFRWSRPISLAARLACRMLTWQQSKLTQVLSIQALEMARQNFMMMHMLKAHASRRHTIDPSMTDGSALWQDYQIGHCIQQASSQEAQENILT